MTLMQKQELYRHRFAPVKRMTAKEWQKLEDTKIRLMGCGLVLMTILLYWMVGSK